MNLYDVVSILDLNELKNLNSDLIKKAYRKMMLKYHPDVNSDMTFIATEISKVLNAAYQVALSKIDAIRNETIIGNAEWAKLNGKEKKSLFGVNNNDTRSLTVEFMSKLLQNGLSVIDLIKFMNSLEYGLITVSGAKSIYELWGEEAYSALGEFLDLQSTNDEKYYEMLKKLNYLFVDNNVQKR